MFGLIALGVAASVLAVGAIGLIMFAETAVGEPRPLHARSLPLLTGDALRQWATERARTTTLKWLTSHPKREHPDRLARQLEGHAGQLLDQAIFRESATARGIQPCREGTSVPRVTAPETFAIADEVLKLPAKMRIDISSHAAAAAKSGHGGCPLLSSQGMCLCAIARPLGCRGRCLAGFDSIDEAARWADTLEAGLSDGLQQELKAAGLDGDHYDLNEALAAVLPEPSVESRWRQGEKLLK